MFVLQLGCAHHIKYITQMDLFLQIIASNPNLTFVDKHYFTISDSQKHSFIFPESFFGVEWPSRHTSLFALRRRRLLCQPTIFVAWFPCSSLAGFAFLLFFPEIGTATRRWPAQKRKWWPHIRIHWWKPCSWNAVYTHQLILVFDANMQLIF